MAKLAPLRLNILSDLHLSQGGLPLPETSADVIVLAGDITRPREAIEWARGFDKPVIYIAGNHEFYGGSLPGTLQELKQRSEGTHIHVLDKDELILQGVRFLGATLWTDFLLYGHGPQREEACRQAQLMIRDFSRIQLDASHDRRFSPSDSEVLCKNHSDWLDRKLSETYKGPTVVITHHAPWTGSIHPRFAGSPLNVCYVSRLEHLMSKDRAILWIHGHTHDSFDYLVKGTRVICNPRGYCMNGINENAAFDPRLIVEVER